MREETETDSLPYVASIICHYVGMFAALYYDDFLLDDRKIILCGTRKIKQMHESEELVKAHHTFHTMGIKWSRKEKYQMMYFFKVVYETFQQKYRYVSKKCG